MQIGLISDVKTYTTYERGQTHSSYIPAKVIPIHLLTTVNYTYYHINNINYYLTGGLLFGNSYFIDKYSYLRETNFLGLITGAGVSVRVYKRIELSITPLIKYSSGFFPGILFNSTISINNKHSGKIQ